MVQEFLSLLTVLVFAVLAALVRIYVPLAIAAFNRKAEAVLGTANRDALYAAVKVGLNAAMHSSNWNGGEFGNEFLQRAVGVASMYLQHHNIPVDTVLLHQLIKAEEQKRSDRKAEFGAFANPLPESTVQTIELDIPPIAQAGIEQAIADAVAKAVKAQV